VLKNASYVCAYLTIPSLPPAFPSTKELGRHVLVQWFPETSNKAILVLLNVEAERVEIFAGRKPKKKLNKKKLNRLYKDKIGKALLAEKQFDEAVVFFSGKILTLLTKKGGFADTLKTMAPMLVPVLVILMFQMKGSSSSEGGGISGLLGGLLGKRKKRYGGQEQPGMGMRRGDNSMRPAGRLGGANIRVGNGRTRGS